MLNIFPSIDTGVCAASVRRFNELAAGLENTTVVCASADLPFALDRFCGAESLQNVVVLDENGSVVHAQVVPEITTEPDYDAALATLN